MFVSLMSLSLTLLFPIGHASLPLIINTWPFANATAAGKDIRSLRHVFTQMCFKGLIQARVQSSDFAVKMCRKTNNATHASSVGRRF